MLEIVFNELSLREKTTSIAHSQDIFSAFLQLADKINSLKIAPIRIRMSVDLPNISIGEDYYTIKDWLKTLDNDRRQRYVAFLVQNPIITDNPYFFYKELEVHGFGYAFNNSLGSVSFSTNNVWNDNIYKIRSEFLADAESEVIVETVEIKHLLDSGTKVNHEKWLKEEFKIKQLQLSKELPDLITFWEMRETLFPSLVFCQNVLEQIQVYESINNPSFKKVQRYLHTLETHMLGVKNNQKKIEDLPGDISNDSRATLDKYGEDRTFTKPDNNVEVFSLHCKLGDVRLYMSYDHETIIIGYIGRHLSTVKFSK